MKNIAISVSLIVAVAAAAVLGACAGVAFGDTPLCPAANSLVAAGLLSADEMASMAPAVCNNAVNLPIEAPVNTSAALPVAPPFPSPGAGDLHLVTQWLTKQVSESAAGQTLSLGSVAVSMDPQGLGYSTDVAFAASGPQLTPASACGTAESGLQPWQVRSPPALGTGPFTYPTSGAVLQQLANAGYIDSATIDLATVPDASAPTDVWARQPTFGDVLGDSTPWGLANTLVPGQLFINMTLVSSPGDSQWRVQEWNYAFAVHAQLTDVCPAARTPEPTICPLGTVDVGQPLPANGDCSPVVACPSGALPQADGSCGGKADAVGQVTCVGGPRSGEVPPADVNVTAWCVVPSPSGLATLHCSAVGDCPAVLTCGGGVPCSPPSGPRGQP